MYIIYKWLCVVVCIVIITVTMVSITLAVAVLQWCNYIHLVESMLSSPLCSASS